PRCAVASRSTLCRCLRSESEASFVARTIDSDRKHLQSVLREATAHRGASLVEIYQNCNIFNDNAFEPLKDPELRDDITLKLEHGQPIASRSKAVVRAASGSLEVVARDSVDAERILVHDAHNPD